MHVLAISGSARRHSLNTRLAELAAEVAFAESSTVLADLRGLPYYDGDLEAAGVPAAVAGLRAQVAAADLIVVATPEYNGTIPGLLGNAVDWLSRPHGRSPLRGKPVLVLSASPSPRGAAKAGEHLRGLLAVLGAQVLPHGLAVGAAHQRLGSEADPRVRAELAGLLDQLVAGRSPAPALAIA